jgi:ketose-bisphosphate aldolase
VTMGPMLRAARAAKYGIAAFNMIDYNSARAIVDGAAELDAPIIAQVSVKTVKLWGYRPIAQWVRELASSVGVPVALHLDHCKDVEVVKRCIDAGWTSVMFDGSALPFEENLARTGRVYEIANAAGVGLEAEIGAIGGAEDDRFVADNQAALADIDECVAFCRALPGLAAFAPAIGTAHGFYKGAPKIAYGLLDRISGAIDVPIALHGGTGLTSEQFSHCIGAGCAKVNISTMHKHQFIEGFIGLRAREPKQTEPIAFIQAQYEAMKADVRDMATTFGSAGRAPACLTA